MTVSNQTIVDRVCDRLKLSPIGDLITEEDLYDITKQAIEKVFFSTRTENTGSYHSRTIPPLIEETIQKALQAQMAEAVNKWMVENSDKTVELWKKVFDKGIVQYAAAVTEAQATAHLKTQLNHWVKTMNEERSRLGLPYLNIMV